jgi:hypothetical protein
MSAAAAGRAARASRRRAPRARRDVDFMTKTRVRRGYPLQTGEIGEGWKIITEKAATNPFRAKMMGSGVTTED